LPRVRSVTYNRRFQPTGRSFNGRTADSDSAYRGSNPCLPAKTRPKAAFLVGGRFSHIASRLGSTLRASPSAPREWERIPASQPSASARQILRELRRDVSPKPEGRRRASSLRSPEPARASARQALVLLANRARSLHAKAVSTKSDHSCRFCQLSSRSTLDRGSLGGRFSEWL
jgi:hypothetical protein